MDEIFKVYIAGLIVSTAISAWIALYSWKHRSSNRAPAFTGVMLCIMVWLATSILDQLIRDPGTKIFLNKLGYFGVIGLPAAWVAFSIQYSGNGKLLTPRRVALFLILPAVLVIIVWSGLLWSSVQFIQRGPFLHFSTRFSNWIWPQAGYSYILNLLGSFLIVRSAIGQAKIYRLQTIALLVGATIPLLVNLVYILGLFSNSEYDLTPISFTVSGIAIAWGLFRYKLFALVPVARETLIENMPIGFLVLNEQFKVADLNQTAQAMLGWTRSAALGKPAAQIFPASAGLLTRITAEDAFSTDIHFTTGGQERTFELRSARINAGSGDLLGYLLVLQDVTRRILVERNLAESLAAEKELYELRSRLITNTSHEFRTPLSVILSSTELLEHYGSRWTTAKRLEHFQRIKSAVNYMTRMVEEVLVVGKVEAGRMDIRPVKIDLVSFCKNLIEEIRLKDQAEHRFLFESQPGELYAVLDEMLLRQIVTNLLENSVKYSPENTQIRLCLATNGDGWLLDLFDEGFGIPAEDIPHLGEPFYRGANVAHLNGTGLGLTIVLKLLHLVGGTLQIKSAVQQGTQVTLQIPWQN